MDAFAVVFLIPPERRNDSLKFFAESFRKLKAANDILGDSLSNCFNQYFFASTRKPFFIPSADSFKKTLPKKVENCFFGLPYYGRHSQIFGKTFNSFDFEESTNQAFSGIRNLGTETNLRFVEVYALA
ncbi:hypothetical protein M5689_020832 [Euphorbia peplus]|nr:hypothetical protein M5689_020832 [Euphorbia peplus]